MAKFFLWNVSLCLCGGRCLKLAHRFVVHVLMKLKSEHHEIMDHDWVVLVLDFCLLFSARIPLLLYLYTQQAHIFAHVILYRYQPPPSHCLNNNSLNCCWLNILQRYFWPTFWPVLCRVSGRKRHSDFLEYTLLQRGMTLVQTIIQPIFRFAASITKETLN